MYKCIIIDDDQFAIDGLTEYIKSLPNLELLYSYNDPLKGMQEIIDGQKVDIIFMDVNMPSISGIELSKIIRNCTDKLVFTTSYSKHAFNAFEVRADAFLLKPYTLSKFALTIYQLFPIAAPVTTDVAEDDFFFVKNKEDELKLVKVKYKDIIAIESLQNYVRIYTPKQKIVAYFTLLDLRRKLSSRTEFIQVQRSFIISKNFIQKIDGNSIYLDFNINVTVGNFYRKAVSEFIKDKTLKNGNT